MGLTKPTAHQINFDVTNITDPIITLNKLSPQPGTNTNDVGLVIMRGSTEQNATIVWDESTDRFVFGLTSSDGSATNPVITSFANLAVATITDSAGKSFLVEAPFDGNEYVQKNGAWAIASGGGNNHSLLSNLQGGMANEYYHLTLDQHTEYSAKLSNNDIISCGTY